MKRVYVFTDEQIKLMETHCNLILQFVMSDEDRQKTEELYKYLITCRIEREAATK